jgi:hypothetical protein
VSYHIPNTDPLNDYQGIDGCLVKKPRSVGLMDKKTKKPLIFSVVNSPKM